MEFSMLRSESLHFLLKCILSDHDFKYPQTSIVTTLGKKRSKQLSKLITAQKWELIENSYYNDTNEMW